jgi:hypothetical protein
MRRKLIKNFYDIIFIMENDVNHLVFKIINSLLNSVGALPANFEFDSKDVYSPIKYKVGPVGRYHIIFIDDNNKRVKLDIFGVRHDDSMTVSEIEKYIFEEDNLKNFRDDDLYSEFLIHTLNQVLQKI